MSDRDHKRFAELLAGFVDGCGFERPFHIVVLDRRGSVVVSRYSLKGIDQVCSGPVRAHNMRMIPPIVVTAISGDGIGKSAVIEIEPARGRMQ